MCATIPSSFLSHLAKAGSELPACTMHVLYLQSCCENCVFTKELLLLANFPGLSVQLTFLWS